MATVKQSKPEDDKFPDPPYVPIDHVVHGYRIAEIPDLPKRRYHVWRPDGTRLTQDFYDVQGVSRYGAALELVYADRETWSWPEASEDEYADLLVDRMV